ncbi:MAG TPA: alpha/beta fold hydrolase [Acidimicrobiales bacterium]|nr:alpha/beta fold hydrolase [Acidimicrobiales bacterium]
MPSVRVGDVDVAYEVQGSGDAVVLVHGSTGSRATWIQQTPTLAERYTVVLPEYAGGGESTTPDRPLEVDELVAQVLGAVDDAGVETFHLAGYSLGAVVAAALAAEQPERVRTLALVNGWARTDARMKFTFDLWKRLYESDIELFARYVLADGLGRDSFELFGDGIDAMIPMIAGQLSAGTALHAELDSRIDIEDRLSRISAPTLIVGGLTDRWVDIHHSRTMAQAIDGAHLEELECGHVSLTEKAPEVTGLLLEHFDR